MPASTPAPKIGLFVTCPVDLMRPSVAFACVKLLEDAGCEVVVPPQSCCGQVAWNNGLSGEARTLARQVVAAFAAVDYVVAPSGSCASMLKNHYPTLFADSDELARVEAFSARVYELTVFLHDVLGVQSNSPAPAENSKTVAYHDSCAGLRELGIRHQPRALARHYRGVHLGDLEDSETCCGFGGTFCVKFADISNHMVTAKARQVAALHPDLLLGGDLSCLLNLAGKLRRQGDRDTRVFHIAEFLAGWDDRPALGWEE